MRAYYDSVSNGVFQLHVRMINPADDQGYPRWVELPETKAHYAEIKINDMTQRPGGSTRLMGDWFWDDAYAAAQAAVDGWYPHTNEYDLPNNSYDTARRLRHKVVYLYSGATYDNYGLLHPQVDATTSSIPKARFPESVGYRYVMGERQGWGNNDYDIDEFAGIGTHAHEIGHLLGLEHGEGSWVATDNRYVPGTAGYTNARGANMLGWTLMQGGGEQGPRSEDDGYYVGYRSCPNPINPFYRMDLGWLTPTEILGSQDDYAIAAGTTHRIDRGGVSYLLNRRTTQPFGGRYLAFYDYAAPGNEGQGLMIWRREFRGEERPILIVADERRYRDARDKQQRPSTQEYQDMLSDPFPGRDKVTAVNALTGQVGLRQATNHSIKSNGTSPSLGRNRDPNRLDLALTNITYDRATDMMTVDIDMAPPQRSSVVSFGSASYKVTEGGAGVLITVSLSPVPSQAVHIPVQVSADAGTEAGDYAVAGLKDGTVWLSFAAGSSSQSFTLTANEDDDSADETVTLSFGTLLPSGVTVGRPSQATVTLRDADEDLVPVFTSSRMSKDAIIGQYFSFTRPSAKGGNAPLTYSVSGSCAGLTVTASSVSGQPRAAGQCGITWTVRDTDGDDDTYALQISVAADTTPTFASSGTSRGAIVGQYFSFSRPSASGGNGSLRYSVSGSCVGLTVTASSVSGTPRAAGRCGIRWTVRDADGDTDTYALQLNVHRPSA